MGEFIIIDISQLNALIAKLGQLPDAMTRYLDAAGKEASDEVLDTRGLRSYPPSGPANAPPVPYYIRGSGMQYNTRNDGRSERYGSQWQVSSEVNNGWTTTITNQASYAPYLAGKTRQASHMARLGWRKLADVAAEKKGRIVEIFKAWVIKGIRDLGL